MRRIAGIVVGGLVGSLCAGTAWASSYDEGCGAYESGGVVHYYGTCDAPTQSSPAEVDASATRASVGFAAGAVANRVANVLGGGGSRQTASSGDAAQTGVSTGDGAPRYALWASIGGNTLSSSVSGAAFDGTLSAQTLGFDVLLSPQTVVGVSVFHEGNDFDTEFNGGRLDGDTWSVVPYAGYDFGQGTTLDGLVGLSYVTGKATRAGGGATGAKGDFDGYRAMAALNGHHNLSLGGPWNLRGDLGTIMAYSRNNAYTETGIAAQRQERSTNHLVQGKAGARLSYLWDRVEPYGAAYYAYDFVSDRTGNGTAPGGGGDSDEFQFYAGLDWYATDTESVGLEVSHVVGRTRTDSTGLLFNARLRF